MIRFKRITKPLSKNESLELFSVMDIYEKAFPYYKKYSEKIQKIMYKKNNELFEPILIVAEGRKSRILGFALCFYFRSLKLAYLDYIASKESKRSRGIGTSLYEVMKEILIENKVNGLLFDVPSDDPLKISDKPALMVNRKRLKFYESLGAYPIINTKYENLKTIVNEGYFTFMVFDNLGSNQILSKKRYKLFLDNLFKAKYNIDSTHPHLQNIKNSINDDPIVLRKPQYIKPEPININNCLKSNKFFEFICVSENHKIHHIKTKGYVERPARINAIIQGIKDLPYKNISIRNYSDKNILAVHSPELVTFLKSAENEMKQGEIIYPDVFPIRRPNKAPAIWENQPGYFCIDTFTPIYNNAYKIAREAADAALTGASRIKCGATVVYALCRPPGHHAERLVFGGFCYLNNAAIASHYLSKTGRVCLIDIDYHHGNGSQNIFYKRSDVLFISIHGHPNISYPYFAGYKEEKGTENGVGYNLNFPLFSKVNDKEYLLTLSKAIATINTFSPDYIVISLGFDIMKGDPTGKFNITPSGIKDIAKMFGALNIPTLIIQEGGYSLKNLSNGIKNFMLGFLETTGFRYHKD